MIETEDKDALDSIPSDVIVSWSIEMSAHQHDDAHDIAELLPRGTSAYLSHLPRHSLDDTINAAIAVQDVGLEPVPHVAARRIADKAELDRFLKAASRLGIGKMLLLGGDLDAATGPFADAASLLKDGMLADHGIREVGFAATPKDIRKFKLNY